MLQIRCKNNNKTKSFAEGTSLLDVYQEFADDIKLRYPVVAAKVNNVSQGLKFRLFQNRDVEFMDASEGSGHRCYVRSLSFVLYTHLLKNFPQFVVTHTVKGFGIVNKAQVDVFLELSCFFHDPTDVGNLKPA